MESLPEIIKQRYSCRSFMPALLDNLVKQEINSFIVDNNTGLWGEKLELQIIEKQPASKRPMRLDYGVITNHNTYIAGVTRNDFLSRMSYGYVVEKVVLKVTSLGLSSCWIGYFDPDYFQELKISSGLEIPSIVIIGYSAKQSFGNRIIRMSVNASKRKNWEDLFYYNRFDNPLPKSNAHGYEQSLEMLRLAPSSGNTQPWRVIMDETNNRFNFYKKIISKKYEARGLHDVDLGIAAAHFELISELNGLNGHWKRLDDKEIPDIKDLNYMISWVIK